jgi:hypothetical protein
MMKKSGAIAALTVALLAMAVLVTQSCQLPETDSESKTGNVRIIIGDNARTILPTAPTFVSYELAFVNSTVPLSSQTIYITSGIAANGSASIPSVDLGPGTYTLTVIGFVDDPDDPGNNTLPVAIATTAATPGGITVAPPANATPPGGFTIAANDIITLTVGTKPYALGTAGEVGTFSHVINLSGIIGTPTPEPDYGIRTGSTMLLRTYGASPSTAYTINLVTGPLTDMDDTIPTGIYYADFYIDTVAKGFIQYRDLVYIYRNMTSTLTRTFTRAELYLASLGNITYTHPGDFANGVIFSALFLSNNGPGGTASGGGTNLNPFILSRADTANAPNTLIITPDFDAVDANNDKYLNNVTYTWSYGATPVGLADTALEVDANDPYFNEDGSRSISLDISSDEGPFIVHVWIRVNP